MIPICDLTRQYQSLKPHIDTAMSDVAASGHYILGPQTRAFESEMASYLGCQHAVGVGNGTDALHLALRALGIGPGDEVITTPFTFIATTEAIGIVGATPVFVDINPDTFNINPSRLKDAITPKTRAILPVHLYGQPCDMDPIMEVARTHGLFVVEDCAQAVGAQYRGRPVGTIGDVGCFSFFPTKNLGALGDGGMVTTNNTELFERVEMLRRHGGKVKYHHVELGINSRLDELQSAILRVKLGHLSSWTEQRRQIAYRYNALLQDVPGVDCPRELMRPLHPTYSDEAPDAVRAVYHQYTVLVRERGRVAEHLKRDGIATMIYYPIPLHSQEVHANLGLSRGAYPNTERIADSCLSLPMFPELSADEQDSVVASIKAAVMGS